MPRVVLLIVMAFAITISCKKNGVGGKATIKGVVKHHDTAIPNAIVYIKYDATEFPGQSASNYDDHVTADANGNYEFGELLKGEYYLYGTGYDLGISENVVGGIPVSIGKRKDELNTNIPVTEDSDTGHGH